MIRAVLFDLDGTFADTAPDLAYALNHMRRDRGLPPLPLSVTRPVTSLGARGLLHAGFSVTRESPDYLALREEFLSLYEQNLCRETRLFPGTAEVLKALESRGLRWGIVTNKSERLARLLLDQLPTGSRAACVIGGDSTGKIKPHPEPLLAACRAIGAESSACIYVGDDRRDVEAGHAAGMKVAVVGYGYLDGNDPENWNADWIIEKPQDLLRLI
jgi:N-acetyl-D-muramate 6-phosphate phosphatase